MQNEFSTADEIRLVLSVMKSASYSGNSEQLKYALSLHDQIVYKLEKSLKELEQNDDQISRS